MASGLVGPDSTAYHFLGGPVAVPDCDRPAASRPATFRPPATAGLGRVPGAVLPRLDVGVQLDPAASDRAGPGLTRAAGLGWIRASTSPADRNRQAEGDRERATGRHAQASSGQIPVRSTARQAAPVPSATGPERTSVAGQLTSSLPLVRLSMASIPA
jgi:hypothetical protein